MAIIVLTHGDPKGLLDAIKEGIDNKRIRTWQYDEDGDFTHAREQWRFEAWLRPAIHGKELRFTIFPPSDEEVSVETYAIYHGRFVEMILAHFDRLFVFAVSSALPQYGDVVSSVSDDDAGAINVVDEDDDNDVDDEVEDDDDEVEDDDDVGDDDEDDD